MFSTKEKKERALGVKLFLKPGRCTSTKCAMIRRPQRPGQHGKRYRRSLSEFGQQLAEKQKIRYIYGLNESQFERFFRLAAKSKTETGPMLMQLLERRLDNVVFRSGFTKSRSIARQLVNHGHITVNGKIVRIPSYLVDKEETVSIRPQSGTIGQLKDVQIALKHYEAPKWLALNKDKLESKVMNLPQDIDHSFDLGKIIDFYSK